MENYLLVSTSLPETEAYLLELQNNHRISPNQILRFNNAESPLTVETFRDVIKLTTHHFDQKTLIVVDNFQNISEVIQNTFLKTLEEHQENVGYVLITTNASAALPTIRSRCQIISLKGSHPNLSEEDKQELETLLNKLKQNPSLLVSSQISLGLKNKKDKAVDFLDKLIVFGRNEIMRKPDRLLARWLKRALNARVAIKNNNLDPELALDQVFVDS